MKLSGKTALVTGGARGIGRAIAQALAREGAQVAILDILVDDARATCQALEASGAKALAIGTDLTKRADVNRAVEQVLAQWGAIDVIVNNAGWDKMEFFLDSEEETWDRIIAINFKALLYVLKAALPHMTKRKSGKVISIASDAGRVGSMGESVYAGTKGAVIAFSKTVAREMARSGVTVNVVCPGLTETPLLQSVRDTSPTTAKIIEAVTRSIPLGRVGRPEDVAEAVVFLASPAADFITGQTLSVSGGLTMC